MVISTGIYCSDELDGFGFQNKEGKIVGLITYILEKDVCETISLDSIVENNLLEMIFY